MAKPSIFSREYKRRMRERKRRVGIIIVIMLAVSGIVLSSGYVKGWFQKGITVIKNNRNDAKSLLTGKSNDQKIDDKKTEAIDKVSTPQPSSTPEIKIEVEKFFEATLADGKVIKVVYDEAADGKKLKHLKDAGDLYYNISPNGKNLVTWEVATQNMMLIDSEGAVKDITKPFYKTRNTGDTIKKETQLTRRPNFIWSSTPKFISDDTIAYVTNLPLLSMNNPFIWVYDMKVDDHVQIYSKTSKAITFKELIDGKLAIDIDGSPKYLLPDRNITD